MIVLRTNQGFINRASDIQGLEMIGQCYATVVAIVVASVIIEGTPFITHRGCLVRCRVLGRPVLRGMASGLVTWDKRPIWVFVSRVLDRCIVDLNFCARKACGTVWVFALGFCETLEAFGLVTYGTFELHDLLSCALHAADGLGDSAMVLDVVACISKLLVRELCRDKILVAATTLDLGRKSNATDIVNMALRVELRWATAWHCGGVLIFTVQAVAMAVDEAAAYA